MRRYNLIQPFAFAFFSKGLYRDVRNNWRGIGFGYLFILLIFSVAVSTYVLDLHVKRLLDYERINIAEQMPVLVFNGGELSVNKPVPYVIHYPGKGEYELVIDTSVSQYPVDKMKNRMVLTKDRIYMFDEDSGKTQMRMIPKTWDFKFGRRELTQLLAKIKTWFVWFCFPIYLLIAFVYRILQALVYAVITLIFAAMLKVKLEYTDALRLSCVAVTPAVILSTMADFLVHPPAVALRLVVYALVTLFYLFFALLANRQGD